MTNSRRKAPAAASEPMAREGSPNSIDSWIVRLANRQPPAVLGYALTILVVLINTLIEQVLPIHALPFLMSIPVIFISGLVFGRAQGLAATALSAALANYFFSAPGPVSNLSRADLISTSLFIGFAGFIVLVSGAVRRAAVNQAIQIARLRTLQTAAEASEQALRASQDALRRMNETLEQQIQARTAELERARKVLGHAQKMEALGELTAGLRMTSTISSPA